jgi:Domain of unknown function (DUF5597)
LAPDLYLPYFNDVCETFSRNGSPLFIPETGMNAANAIVAAGKYNAIGFSPFFIERGIAADSDLAATYRILGQMPPLILAHQGSDSMTAVRLNQDDPPKKIVLGGYTLELTYVGRGRAPIAPEPKVEPASPPNGQSSKTSLPAPGPKENRDAPVPAAAVFITSAPDQFYLGGGGMRIAFTSNMPGPPTVGLGDVQEGKFVDGKWVVTRQLGGDDTGQGEILTLRPDTILRVTVYRYPS